MFLIILETRKLQNSLQPGALGSHTVCTAFPTFTGLTCFLSRAYKFFISGFNIQRYSSPVLLSTDRRRAVTS